MEKKIVCKGVWWSCENLDLNAPISEQGTAYLLTDNTTVFLKENENIPCYSWANQTELKAFGNQRGIAYMGNEVEIIKGKMKGLKKIINGFLVILYLTLMEK